MNNGLAEPPYNRGKWAREDVPQSGWEFLEMEFLKEGMQKCEMCEHTRIRYAHHMRHPDFHEVLRVGCICAGHMEGNHARSADRERKYKNLYARREYWIVRPWKLSKKGNRYLNTDGFNITVFRSRPRQWSAWILDRTTPSREEKIGTYRTQDEAKLAAFDRMIFLKDNAGWGKRTRKR